MAIAKGKRKHKAQRATKEKRHKGGEGSQQHKTRRATTHAQAGEQRENGGYEGGKKRTGSPERIEMRQLETREFVRSEGLEVDDM